MADPLTLAMIGMAVAVAGAGVSAMGAKNQAKAQSDAALYNAKLAEQNATAARQQAGADASAQQRDARRQLGAMRANSGASGVTLEGSPLDVLESSAASAKLDELNIRYKGEMAATGYGNQADLDRQSADVAVSQGKMNAASSVLTGVGQAINMGAQTAAMKKGGF